MSPRGSVKSGTIGTTCERMSAAVDVRVADREDAQWRAARLRRAKTSGAGWMGGERVVVTSARRERVEDGVVHEPRAGKIGRCLRVERSHVLDRQIGLRLRLRERERADLHAAVGAR